MNQFFMYYYNFMPSIILDKDSYYLINYHNLYYRLYKVDDISFVMDQFLISRNYSFFYSFVENKYQDIFSYYQKVYYVLLKVNDSVFNRLYLLPYHGNMISLDWKKKWIQKSEFIQSYYFYFKGKYNIIDESIDYFLSLLELSIFYIGDYDSYFYPPYISHSTFSIEEYFNPLDIKIDVAERDFGEYLKYLFFHDLIDKSKIRQLLYENRNVYRYSLVLARVLYPNYYFDLLDLIFMEKKDSSILDDVLGRVLEFKEYFLFLEDEISKYIEIKKVLL